jgi:hypothetical protein
MGNSSSSTAKNVSNVVNSSITEISNSTSTSANAITFQGNTFDFINSGKYVNCNTNVTQVNKGDQKLTVSSTVTNTTKLQDELSTSLSSKVKNLTEQEQGALAIGFNCSNNVSEIEQNVSDYVKKQITNTTTTEVKAFVNQLNKAKFVNYGEWDCGGSGGTTINQDNVTNQVVSLIAKSLNTSDTATKIANALEASSENVTSQKMTGIMDSLAGLVGGAALAAVIMAFAPAIIIICLLCCCCMAFKKGGSSAPAAAPAAAKSAFGKKVKFV